MHGLNLKVNTRIEVIENEKAYKSLIVDVEGENIKINIPVNNGEYMILEPGDTIEINMFLEDGHCFDFYCTIISKGVEDNISYYELDKPFDITIMQRRKFFRVGILNPVYCKNITNIDEDEIEYIPYKEVLMIDLSGGGAKLKLKDVVNEGDELLFNMRIKNNEIVLRGNVVRVENIDNNEKLCGINFIDINELQRDMIISELFEIMRKQRSNK